MALYPYTCVVSLLDPESDDPPLWAGRIMLKAPDMETAKAIAEKSAESRPESKRNPKAKGICIQIISGS